ncbi:MAG: 2-oxo acid dehydrogenase subunit E2 [Acidimicrobiales bacterium]|nr:2-oxo acid dehydrogenase subunit E2 [Acidimicrobiales bacterium]
MGEFKMPSLGADMEVGKVAKWLVGPGDVVRRGDVVAVVETEKSTIEVEIFEAGVIEELLVPEGDEVPVGTALARVGASGGTAARAPAPEPAPEPATKRRRSAVGAPAAASTRMIRSGGLVVSPVLRHLAERLGVDVHALDGSGAGGMITRADVESAGARLRQVSHAPMNAGRRAPVLGARPSPPPVRRAHPSLTGVRSSPLARRVADELNIEIDDVQGTGPGGAIVVSDVRRAAQGKLPEAAPSLGQSGEEEVPKEPGPDAAISGTVAGDARQVAMRRAIGALMARSKREIPHYYLSTDIDMSRAVAWLEQANVERPVTARLVVPALLIKATALAVATVPEMNGFMTGDTFEPSADVHVGVAVSLRTGGVIAPAIHHVDRLSVDELMVALRDLVNRARGGMLRSSEMSDPTITVTNLGDLGVDSVFGVIYPPQVALVGFGRVAERAWAADGMVGVRSCATATLSADHRVSDGHRGGRFLGTIDRLLQHPEEL